jgi:hypothetical protein
MNLGRSTQPVSLQSVFGPAPKHGSIASTILLACAAFTALSSVPQQPSPNQPPQYIEKSYPVPAGNEWPDKNSQMQMHDKLATKKHFEAANLERKRQIDNDSAELLKLATELKAAIDKSRNDTLPVDIIRKAELIEKLAHGVKQKMRLTVSGS